MASHFPTTALPFAGAVFSVSILTDGHPLFESERLFLLEYGFAGQRNRIYLVRMPRFEARVLSEARDARWFTLEELDRERGRPWEYEELVRSASDW